MKSYAKTNANKIREMEMKGTTKNLSTSLNDNVMFY